jgi:hypothetical protein
MINRFGSSQSYLDSHAWRIDPTMRSIQAYRGSFLKSKLDSFHIIRANRQGNNLMSGAVEMPTLHGCERALEGHGVFSGTGTLLVSRSRSSRFAEMKAVSLPG